MTVALLIIGDEVLSGHVHDLNTHNLAGRFRDLGYELTEVRVVPDVREVIAGAVRDMAAHGAGGGPPAFLFTCGGIGPTPDDVTHEAVAEALGVPLEENGDMVEMIRAFYAKKRWCCDDGEELRPNEASMKMAMVPEGMSILKNDRGTAPGLWTRMEGGPTTLVILPGPPGEVEAIFDNSIAGKVMPAKDDVPVIREVLVPHGESLFAGIICEVLEARPEVQIGSYPQQGRKLVILRLKGEGSAVAEAESDVRKRLRDAGLM